MFKKILIPNQIIHTARRMDILTVAVARTSQCNYRWAARA